MKFLLLVTLLCAAQLAGCRGPENDPSSNKTTRVVAAVDAVQGKASLLAFLKALQTSDKKAAYAASNLTPELVEESRKVLVNQPVNKPAKQQIAEAEHALSMSGSIDLYLKKMQSILPKSAMFEVVKSGRWSDASPNVLIHEVKITYANQKEAISDEKNKRVKEFILRFLQIQYEVNGRQLQEFLIEDKDFEKMMERKFEVKSYF